ncbi:GNAT family N-acetyltransferase [Microbacterium sp. QXD-8]|uniref:GNAT family N-acetyltransferase n=1 Tax=Microbacterium psychrotolerans TaxID=3068321 RepID=A0ABU0Z526_9MICO|nr:GNAT family N-acetyltransferase [Microbacterium sp. QXD-8]MDQ7879685.1 GNAT family N-acetyltransferase [Microbacterium sp. QXD-8]
MTRIRPFRPGDEPALVDICLRTADAGADATGILDDDDLWAEIFVLPYAAHHPEFAFVVETDDGRVVGYIVGAPDSAAFEEWFATEWWPRHAERWPRPQGEPTATDSRQDGILRYAYARAGGAQPFGDEYPAHLHIDLLPETQGQGLGRRLIETLEAALREAGVPGLHLVASADNTGAIAFYPRVGFEPLPSPEGTQVFATRL